MLVLIFGFTIFFNLYINGLPQKRFPAHKLMTLQKADKIFWISKIQVKFLYKIFQKQGKKLVKTLFSGQIFFAHFKSFFQNLDRDRKVVQDFILSNYFFIFQWFLFLHYLSFYLGSYFLQSWTSVDDQNMQTLICISVHLLFSQSL